jgi:hypothetical protein
MESCLLGSVLSIKTLIRTKVVTDGHGGKIQFSKASCFWKVHNKSLLLEYSISQKKLVIASNVQLKAKLDSMQLNGFLCKTGFCVAR